MVPPGVGSAESVVGEAMSQAKCVIKLRLRHGWLLKPFFWCVAVPMRIVGRDWIGAMNWLFRRLLVVDRAS